MMKGKMVLTLCLVMLVMVIACRKIRTCQCTTTELSSGNQLTTQTEFKDTKKNAKSLCSDLNKNEGDYTTECEIK